MIGVDPYRKFPGESETMVAGTLKGCSAIGILPSIKVPALMTIDRFDEICPMHIPQWNAAEQRVKDARLFLNAAEKRESGTGLFSDSVRRPSLRTSPAA